MARENNRKEETQEFYDFLSKLQNELTSVTVIINGNLNLRVGNILIANTFETFGKSHIHENEHEHAAANSKLKMTNTLFRHKDVYMYTWSARALIAY